MRRIIFKKIKIANFLSIGKTPLELNFATGISLITGENRDKGGRNGVGKSSVIESVYWCLFGNTIRDIKRDKIIHNLSKETCEVKLYFEVIKSSSIEEYILTRKADPNKVELLCNGVDITRSSMPKTDELIKEIIGATEEVFQNAVIMTANNTMPFMAQKKVDKRKFVEGVLHLGVFGEMLLQVRSDLNEAKRENELSSNLFLNKQKNLELLQKQFNKNEENKKQIIFSLEKKINSNLEKIKQISELNADTLEETKTNLLKDNSNKLSKIKNLDTLSRECSAEYETLKNQSLTLKINIEHLEKEKTSLLDKTKECPTCKRAYEDHDKKHVDELIENIQSEISKHSEEHSNVKKKINSQIKNCDKITNTIESLNNDILNNNNKIHSLSLLSQEVKHLTELNDSLESEILLTRNTKNEFEELISSQEKEILDLELQIQILHKKLTMLDAAKYIVSEEGVKTYIIKKMLNILNAKLNYYLQALEAPCKCEFNEVFEETIFNDKGVECSYFNFSGGERKRIDLAILFMFQDILRMQTGTTFSLSMYDELFDSALDEKGVDKILTILKERVSMYQESIYIVSHNKAAVRSEIDQIIILEKQEGATRIVL